MNNHNFKKRLIINKTYKGKLLQRTSCGFYVQQLVFQLKKNCGYLFFNYRVKNIYT